MQRFGFAMGPFRVADLAGIDISVRAKQERRERGVVFPFALTDVSDELVAAGRLGQKTGAGYYKYDAGDRTPASGRRDRADPGARAGPARRRGRKTSEDEIVERCVYALVDEGARILRDGIADSADDIDTIWVNGYGFPAARGGPMRYARETGAERVIAAVTAFAADDPGAWDVQTLQSILAGSRA